jgi:beta-phosphoglucomutase-like phosphatase (HAD superfamily)
VTREEAARPSGAIDTIIFDAEGVVVDTEPSWDAGQSEFLRRRGLPYDRALIKPLLTGRSLVDGTSMLKERFGLDGDVESLAAERAEIVREAFASAVGFVAGFPEFFERISRDHKRCIATAMAADLLELVDRRLHLRELFAGHVYTIADVGNRSKPDPSLFLFAAAALGSSPRSCMVIEDSPYGIEAARRAHMTAVGLTTTYDARQLADADLVIGSFEELELPLGR